MFLLQSSDHFRYGVTSEKFHSMSDRHLEKRRLCFTCKALYCKGMYSPIIFGLNVVHYVLFILPSLIVCHRLSTDLIIGLVLFLGYATIKLKIKFSSTGSQQFTMRRGVCQPCLIMRGVVQSTSYLDRASPVRQIDTD